MTPFFTYPTHHYPFLFLSIINIGNINDNCFRWCSHCFKPTGFTIWLLELLIVLLQFCVSGLKTSNYGNIHDISFVILVWLMCYKGCTYKYLKKKEKYKMWQLVQNEQLNYLFQVKVSLLFFQSILEHICLLELAN